MNSVFWAGILIGGVVGLVGSILGNILTRKIDRLLEETSVKRFNRQKEREINRYRRLNRRLQHKTAVLFAVFDGTISLILAAASFEIINLSVFLMYLVESDSKHSTDTFGAASADTFAIAGFTVAGVAMSVSSWRLVQLASDIRRLSNFTGYLADLEKRFGMVPSDHP